MFKEIVKIIRTTVLVSIKSYQITRPLRTNCCRFYPSCSDYARQAIEKYGILKGMFLSLIRTVKCHPWHQGGVDLI